MVRVALFLILTALKGTFRGSNHGCNPNKKYINLVVNSIY